MEQRVRWESLISRQQGAFSVTQANAAGVDSAKLTRGVRAGRIRRGLPGVYLLSGSPRGWQQRAHEVLLWAGPASALSHTTSARMLRLEVDRDLQIHVTTPRNLRAPAPNIRVHRRSLPPCDRSIIDNLSITTMPRTIIDLAAVLSEESLDIALDSAIRRGMPRHTFLERFEALSTPGRRGVATLRRLVAERETEQGLTGSAFERRLLRLIRRSGLPLPVCQHPVRNESITAFIDFAYPEFGIAIEADGYRWHDGRRAFEKDRVRTSELGNWGWRVLQVTWLQLKYNPEGVVQRIRRALATPATAELRF